jgi:hypothetical protein
LIFTLFKRSKYFKLFFLTSREVVTDLIEEYKAAEKADYVTWGMTSSARDDNRMAGSLDEDA